VQAINPPLLFIHRLKINHKSCGSYVFILEESAAANTTFNTYLLPEKQWITFNVTSMLMGNFQRL
jgi:hypothetical protein